MIRRKKSRRKISKPLRVRNSIVVGISDNFTLCGAHSDIAGVAEAAVRNGNHPEAVLFCYYLSAVGGAVVYDDYLEVGIIDLSEAFQAVADGSLPVVSADDNRNARPV